MNLSWVGPVASFMFSSFWLNVVLALTTLATSLFLGVMLGSLSTIRLRPLQLVIGLYVDLWRGLPTIVTLFLVFFLLPLAGIHVNAFVAAAIGLTLWGSANISEIARGAVQSIPATQHRAATALGLNDMQKFIWVIIPQAARRMLPPLVSFLAHLIQNSTLAGLIGVTEVLAAGKYSIGRLTIEQGNPHAAAIYAAAGIAFFAICFPLSRWAVRLENRLVV